MNKNDSSILQMVVLGGLIATAPYVGFTLLTGFGATAEKTGSATRSEPTPWPPHHAQGAALIGSGSTTEPMLRPAPEPSTNGGVTADADAPADSGPPLVDPDRERRLRDLAGALGTPPPRSVDGNSPQPGPMDYEGDIPLEVESHHNSTRTPEPAFQAPRRLGFALRGERITLTHDGESYVVPAQGQLFRMRLYEKVPVRCKVERREWVGRELHLAIAYSGVAEYDLEYVKLEFTGRTEVTATREGGALSIVVRDTHGYGIDESIVPLLTDAYIGSVAPDGRPTFDVAPIAQLSVYSVWSGSARFRGVPTGR
ncbi:MAG: hypothetical protein KDC95_19225 [Planctomycetes bacterium]|nr:hypothetical protein [Planctomycetota bacterium]